MDGRSRGKWDGKKDTQFMLSEWFLQRPDHFPDRWLVKLAPVGQRCLVVSGNGRTVAYRRNGRKLRRPFPSHLPGGNYSQKGMAYNKMVVLDCIFSGYDQGTFYVLDMMFWGEMPFYECDTDFRFHWLQTKFDEAEGGAAHYGDKGHLNTFSFRPLPFRQATDEAVGEMMGEPNPFPMDVDGLLFYHKQAHYLPGRRPNPLVLWMKPYMPPELLKVAISDEYASKAPPSYTDAKAFMEEYARESELIGKAKKAEAQARRARRMAKNAKDQEMDEADGDAKEKDDVLEENMEEQAVTPSG